MTLPSIGDSWTLTGSLAQCFMGSLLLSPGSWYTQVFVSDLQESVSLALWKFCNQIPLASKVKFIFLGSKITAGGDCSHEIKRRLLLYRKYEQPRQHIKKQRHYFANKVHLVKAMVFSAVMYGCENWTIKKTEY